jgi:hypothetical protein
MSPARGVRALGRSPGVALHTRWSAFSTKTRASPTTVVQAPPPYSCTRERALHGASITSETSPDGASLRTAVRPASSGTDSPHHTSSPTNRAPSMRGDAADTASADSGEGQDP